MTQPSDNSAQNSPSQNIPPQYLRAAEAPAPRTLLDVLRATTEPGHGRVSPVGGPGSHLVGDLASADALVVVPEDVTELPAGAEVGVVLLDAGLEGGH